MGVKLRFRTLKNGSKSYFLDIIKDKERSYEFLKIYISKNDPDKKGKLKQAKAKHLKKQLELDAPVPDRSGYTFKKEEDFIKFFENFLSSYTNKNIRMYERALHHFKSFTGKDKLKFIELNTPLVEKYAEYLQSSKAGLSGETPNNYFTKFKRVVREAYKLDYFMKMPAEFIRVKKRNNELKKAVFTLDEIEKLHQTHCGNEEVKRAFLFSCFVGTGYAEVIDLTWENVVNGKLIYVRKKTKIQVIIPLHQIALDILKTIDRNRKNLFILPSDTAVNKNLRNWVKKANINKKISFYCGRHSLACLLLSNGANLKTVADCLGQSSTEFTIRYLNHVSHLKKEAVQAIPNF